MKPSRDLSAQPDDELARQAAGDMNCFRELHARHHLRLVSLLRSARLKPDMVDDIAQTAWLNAWQRLQSQDFSGNFRAWLCRIGKNAMIDWLRKKFPDRFPESFDAVDLGWSEIVERLEMDESVHKLGKCIELLPEAQRVVVRARLSGQSPQEIAEAAKVDRGRVDRLFFDAKKKLEQCVSNP